MVVCLWCRLALSTCGFYILHVFVWNPGSERLVKRYFVNRWVGRRGSERRLLLSFLGNSGASSDVIDSFRLILRNSEREYRFISLDGMERFSKKTFWKP